MDHKSILYAIHFSLQVLDVTSWDNLSFMQEITCVCGWVAFVSLHPSCAIYKTWVPLNSVSDVSAITSPLKTLWAFYMSEYILFHLGKIPHLPLVFNTCLSVSFNSQHFGHGGFLWDTALQIPIKHFSSWGFLLDVSLILSDILTKDLTGALLICLIPLGYILP